MGKIKWTENASNNLKSIHEYISKDSKVYATRFIKSLIIATKKLTTMPYCGRIVPELENEYLREVIFHNYRVIYRIISENKNIEILAVVHGSRDFNKSILDSWEL